MEAAVGSDVANVDADADLPLVALVFRGPRSALIKLTSNHASACTQPVTWLAPLRYGEWYH